MGDEKTTLAQLKGLMKDFVDAREWNQFHSPKNLSVKMAIEAAELMELFVWADGARSFELLHDKRQAVQDELADVIIVALAFANACSIDISRVVQEKLAATSQRYPVSLCKGKSDKYTAYASLEHKNKQQE